MLTQASHRLGLVGSFVADANTRAQAGAAPIGVLSELTGPYVTINGPGSVLAARMAVADCGSPVLGSPIAVIGGDTVSKPDVAASVAKQWY